MRRRSFAAALVAALALAGELAAQSAADNALRSCVPEVTSRDSLVDSLFAYFPPLSRDEDADEHALRAAEARAVYALLPVLPLLHEQVTPRGPMMPVGGARLWQADLLVWFQVRGDGSVAGMKVERPSVWPDLDVALQRAVLRADSLDALPPVPRQLTGRAVDLWLVVGRGRMRGAENVLLARGVRVEDRYAVRPTQPRFLRTGYRALVPGAMPGAVADTVLFEVMVDTTGLVDPRTIRPIRVRHTEYLEEALRSARASVFEPAHVGPCRVRSRTQLPVSVLFGR